MKCLTLTQPYAQLIALEQKHIETRSWPTNYRGPLAIHAGKGLAPVGGVRGLKRLIEQEPFWSVLRQALFVPNVGYPGDAETIALELDYGAIVATCELIDVVSTNELPVGWRRGSHAWWFTEQERAFGDYSPNRYAWLLANVQPLAEPIPATGQQGLWDYNGDLPH
jgi:activating signal cointegrator 1